MGIQALMAITSEGIASAGLLKEQLASSIKQAIMDGRLRPGERVVEGKWARALGAAQASLREAINLLISEGFLIKDAGRSARVVNYTEEDVRHIYEVRAAIEGLAAELACDRQADLSDMEAALARASAAVDNRDLRAVIESDLDFHIAMAQASGNTVLADMIRHLLTPLFAFIQLRARKNEQAPEAWRADLPRHAAIIGLIREGNPKLAREYMEHCIRCFSASAYSVWQNTGIATRGRAGKRQIRTRN
jgi:DNA-binding GntR family transcriptional regulator